MRAVFRTTLFAALLCVGAAAVAQTKAPAAAPPKDSIANPAAKVREVAGGLLSEQTYKKLTKIYEQIGVEQYNEALAGLQEMYSKAGFSDYEKATMDQAMGHVRLSQEKYDEALVHFRKAVASDTMPNHVHFQMMMQIAQILIMNEKFAEGLKALDDWMKVTPYLTADGFVLKGSALARLEKHREALTAIDKAIEIAAKPKENWYQLKLAMHFELKEFTKCAQVLETLVRMAPDRKNYWTQLSAMYMETNQEQKALAVMSLAHRKGLLDKESEWVQLYQMYGYLNVPYKGAQILQSGIEKGVIPATKKRWEELGNTWYQAKEYDKALEAYAKAAALATDGKVDLQRGYIYVEREKWDDAKQALAAALQKGKLDKPGDVYIMLGMAEYETGNRSEAMKAFSKAKGYDSSASAAGAWIKHIEDGEAAKRAQQELAEEEAEDEEAAGAP